MIRWEGYEEMNFDYVHEELYLVYIHEEVYLVYIPLITRRPPSSLLLRPNDWS